MDKEELRKTIMSEIEKLIRWLEEETDIKIKEQLRWQIEEILNSQ